MLEVVSSLRVYSERHRRYIDGILQEIIGYYGDNLLGLAIFGSFARGENRMNSDLDLLVILNDAPGRRARLSEFIEKIEMIHDKDAQELFNEENLSCEISPYILTESEARRAQPIYYDLVNHSVIVSDRHEIVSGIIGSMAVLLRRVGAKRVRRNNTWEWRTNRYLGGIRL